MVCGWIFAGFWICGDWFVWGVFLFTCGLRWFIALIVLISLFFGCVLGLVSDSRLSVIRVCWLRTWWFVCCFAFWLCLKVSCYSRVGFGVDDCGGVLCL